MAPRKLLIVGNYGAGNLGDDAILGGILTELKELNFQGAIGVTHGGVHSSPEIYKGLKKLPFAPAGLRSRFSKRAKDAKLAFQEADLVILGGGGLFMDEESGWAPYIWYRQAKACWTHQKPYICFGQSLGPLRHFWNRWLTKKVFKRAQAVLVRDEASFDLLKKWGISASLGIDPAFAWLAAEKRRIPKKPILLAILRLWPGFGEKEWQIVLKELKVYAKKHKLKPILMTMDPANIQEQEALKKSSWERFEPSSVRMAFEGLEKAELVFGARLHGAIFALMADTPHLIFSYSQKIKSLFETLDPKGPSNVLQTHELEAEQLRKALKNLDRSKKLSFNLEKSLTVNRHFLAQVLKP